MSVRLREPPRPTAALDYQERWMFEAMGARLMALEQRIVDLEAEIRALKEKEVARQAEEDNDDDGDVSRRFRSCSEGGANSAPSFA